jgi:tetratricopeptide (TPR) repeat protein
MTKRIRSHQLETESFRKFEATIPSQWVFRRKDNDYGIDGEIEIFDDDGKATGLLINVQLKSTDSSDFNKCLKENFKIDTLKYYYNLQYPVLIAKYCSYFDTTYFTWAHSRNRGKPKKGQKQIVVNFSQDNVLNPSIFSQLKLDVINYLNWRKKELSLPLKLSLSIDTKVDIRKTDIVMHFRNYAQINEVHIEICEVFDKDAIGKILITPTATIVSVGGDSASYTFSKPNKGDGWAGIWLADINTSLSILIGYAGIPAIASKLIAPIYKTSTFFSKSSSNLLFGLLKCFYDAGDYHLVLEACKWAIEEKEYIDEVRIFAIWFQKHYIRPNITKEHLFEQILLLISEFFIGIKHEKGISTSYYNLGNFYASLSKYYKALSFYNQARRFDSSYCERHYYCSEVGTVLFNSGRFKLAKKAYKMSLELKDESDIRARYADALIHIGELLEGIKQLRLFCSKNNNSLNWQLKLTALANIRERYNIKDGCRDVDVSRNIMLDDNYSNGSKLIDAIQSDIFNCIAWFNLGVKYNLDNKYEDAFWAFLWAAICCDTDVEAWSNAFLLGCGRKKSEENNFIIFSIFEVAFQKNHENFLTRLFHEINKQPFLKNKEEVKNGILSFIKTSNKSKPVTVRIVDSANNFKEALF